MNSEVNELDLEAEAEYDLKQPQSKGDSFELISGSEGCEEESRPSKETPSIKKKKRRFSGSRKKDEGKVLTFVDMSNLSYLSKSVVGPSLLQPKHQAKQVILPENTKVAILEDESEDYNSEEQSSEKPDDSSEKVKDLTVQDVAKEIFD